MATFIDLFAGVGGFRLALEAEGHTCVFSSEIDPYAATTYKANFGTAPEGDITLSSTKAKIPAEFDILCGGFPCQAFSGAGLKRGFQDTRGTLFFEIASILDTHQPAICFLENVRGLLSHDGGKTWDTVKDSLDKLGYDVYHNVMSPHDYVGVAQTRDRVFIVALHRTKCKGGKFQFPALNKGALQPVATHLEPTVASKYAYTPSSKIWADISRVCVSSTTVYQWRRVGEVRENKSNCCPCLLASMGEGGNRVPLVKVGSTIRKLTPRECFNFQGFPSTFVLPSTISDSKLYKQAGNSVCTKLVQLIASKFVNHI